MTIPLKRRLSPRWLHFPPTLRSPIFSPQQIMLSATRAATVSPVGGKVDDSRDEQGLPCTAFAVPRQLCRSRPGSRLSRHPSSGSRKSMKIRLRVAMGALGVVSMVAGFAAIAAPTPARRQYEQVVGRDRPVPTPAMRARPRAPRVRRSAYALTEQAASHVGGTITVKAGTYTQQLNITSANDGVTIKGVGPTTVHPASRFRADSDTDTDSSQPQYTVVDVAPGVTGFNLKSLSVNGTNGVASLDSDGKAAARTTWASTTTQPPAPSATFRSAASTCRPTSSVARAVRAST